MPRLTEQRQKAIAAVATRFHATLELGADPLDTHLIVAGKRIAIAFTSGGSPASRLSGVAPPRLRFDRVVLRLLGRLRAALDDGVPGGLTVVVTITAPIRLPSKTAATLEESIRTLLKEPSAPGQLRETVHGNQIQVRTLRNAKTSSSKLVGFVHNRDSDPTSLFDLTDSMLRRIGSEPGGRKRWLIIANEDEPSWTETYRHVCSQLFAPTDFERILLVDATGVVSVLAEQGWPARRSLSSPTSPL
jgi:hypothetical protein